MEVPIPYSQIEDVYSVSRWDSSQKFYIRAVIPDGSVLLQLPNKWVRDQWLNSINWKVSRAKQINAVHLLTNHLLFAFSFSYSAAC